MVDRYRTYLSEGVSWDSDGKGERVMMPVMEGKGRRLHRLKKERPLLGQSSWREEEISGFQDGCMV